MSVISGVIPFMEINVFVMQLMLLLSQHLSPLPAHRLGKKCFLNTNGSYTIMMSFLE
jgi:hypothetical protein